MSSGCGEVIKFTRSIDTMPYEQDITTTCGTHVYPEYRYCAMCFEWYSKRHSHGWKVYPGDVCVHGTYVGGMEGDVQCFYCEEAQ